LLTAAVVRALATALFSGATPTSAETVTLRARGATGVHGFEALSTFLFFFLFLFLFLFLFFEADPGDAAEGE
jgi:hypothetical protein